MNKLLLRLKLKKMGISKQGIIMIETKNLLEHFSKDKIKCDTCGRYCLISKKCCHCFGDSLDVGRCYLCEHPELIDIAENVTST